MKEHLLHTFNAPLLILRIMKKSIPVTLSMDTKAHFSNSLQGKLLNLWDKQRKIFVQQYLYYLYSARWCIF